MADFQIECFQNEFLPEGGQVMHAVLTVCASGTGASAALIPHPRRTGPSCSSSTRRDR